MKSAKQKATKIKSVSPPKKVTTLDAAALTAATQHHPGRTGKGGRRFSADPLPQGFTTVIDPSTNPPQPFRNLPVPTGLPPFRLSLDSVLTDAAMATINNSGTMVFHAVGDTGGVNTPTQIENVATYMEKDFAGFDPTTHPSFFYHLGDVVYYDGETPNYFPEFYEPYIGYPAPIFAIPGNHDGDINSQFPETTLAAFVRNFCSQVPVITPEAKDAPRYAMTQPNVYWTLQTPLATFIGLYSNCPEGGQLSQTQIAWFQSELQNAPTDKALIVAVHHPIYSAYGPKPGSQPLYNILNAACIAANNRTPDLVLGGHVHNYQRFTGTLAGKNVPFIIAGAGGYNLRLHTLSKAFHTAKLPIQMTGSQGTLENFCDAQHGYLRITVTKTEMVVDYFAVPDSSAPTTKPLQPFDTLTIPL
jgi:calcineurin-like phosphoesterase family protein